MVVIRLSKKKNNFYYINAIYNKNSVYGKIINRIGIYDSSINYGKNFFLDFNLLFYYIKNGAKISKRVFNLIKL